jgi:N-methylhydantoinase B/oxoprolinase/acetone carboxylase alpha subunit
MGDEAAVPGDVALVLATPVALVVASARWPGFDDVPARALDRFGEGLVVPPTPAAADGGLDPDVLLLVRANVRDPDGVEAVIREQLETASRAAAGLEAGDLADALDRGQREMRAAPRPVHGTWHDGRLAAVVSTDPVGHVIVDLHGSSEAGAEPVNLARPAAEGAVARAAVAALAPDAPQNAGAWSLVEVRIRPGSVLDPPPFAARHRAGETVEALSAGVRAAIAG